MSNMAVLQNTLARTRVLSDSIRLIGGLDEITPPYQRKPGTARLAQNFEADLHGGYRMNAAYERYDGQLKPSDAIYSIISLTITGSIAAADTITGGTSAATATVCAVVTTSSPAYLVVSKITGLFQSGESIKVAGTAQGTSSSLAISNGASTPLLHAQYNNLAADVYRALIGAIPGSGKVLGIVEYGDVLYGFRNAVGGATAAIYKSSGSGWTAVPLGRQVSFTSGGTYEVAEGNTITGATSGATAVITRVVLTSGTWAAGTAAGKLIFASQTGTFQAENLNVGANLNVATIAGNSSAITLLPDGRYEFVLENFGGSANTKRIYGCDGVNKGFEFDGSVYVPIDTGMTADTPSHVYGHKLQLFFSFGASVQHSAPGEPYVWSAVVGASEIGMGDTVTGFIAQPGSPDGGALSIFTRNRTSTLYGSGVVDWQLVQYRRELGAYPYTIQDVGVTMFLDDRGITNLQTAQEYGNFAHSTVTDQIRDRMNEYRLLAVASCISRDRSQYRLFFSSGYAIYVTLVGGKVIGVMPMLFNDVVRCAWSGERASGSEAMYFGSDDGYVYQMDRGTSQDGDAINFYMNLAWNFQGSPRVDKKYRDLTVEVSGSGYSSFNLGHSLGYSDTGIPQPDDQTSTLSFSSSYWDAFVWDAFYWDGISLSPNNVGLDGEAENISIGVIGSSDYYEPFTITSALIHYTPRGRLRP